MLKKLPTWKGNKLGNETRDVNRRVFRIWITQLDICVQDRFILKGISYLQRMEKNWFKPDMRMVKITPKNHIRKVLTGIFGSSVFDTAALTSA